MINNGKNGYFISSGVSRWDGNYWSDYKGKGVFPKMIIGKFSEIIFLSFPVIIFDWHPAKEPYDIGV